jgi:hypothetical protein
MKRTGIFGLAFGLLFALGAAHAGCAASGDSAAEPGAAAGGGDPLDVPADIDPASLDALHRDIVVRSCAAQPGLCHHGQFEPNLSTPALAYENLVLRPAIEHPAALRVAPGEPEKSLLVDKLRNRDVLSQMPLGAEPLPEEEIAAIEAWIAAGALRRPGAEPAPVLNNPPVEPEIGVFDEHGTRLDKGGSVVVSAGTKLVLRHSAHDFETADQDMQYSAFYLELPDGRQVKMSDVPGREDEAATAYDAASAPMGKGDLLDFRLDWTVPDTVSVIAADGTVTEESTAGMSFTVTAAYLDAAPVGEAMLAFTYLPDFLKVSP